jgi:hypothetical protein
MVASKSKDLTNEVGESQNKIQEIIYGLARNYRLTIGQETKRDVYYRDPMKDHRRKFEK